MNVKRVYDKPAVDDGFRILVDRLWPRGLAKAKAKVDLWLKEIAPSDILRKWFAHEPARWEEFKEKYGSELNDKGDLIIQIKQLEKERGIVTLLFGAKDEVHNNAVALRYFLQRR